MANRWRFIPEESWDGPMNMALDVIAAETARIEGISTIRIYRWKPSSLSIGYSQQSSSVNWEYCIKQNIPVIRRKTGGGGIFHDYDGDISYSIIAPVSSFSTDISESYRQMLNPILSTFEQLGISVKFADSNNPGLYSPSCYLRKTNPAHDIMASGKKISGNAQRRSNGVVIQHGSLIYNYDIDHFPFLFSNFNIPPETIQKHMTSLCEQSKATRKDVILTLENSLLAWSSAEKGTWGSSELNQAKKIAKEVFCSTDWTRRL